MSAPVQPAQAEALAQLLAVAEETLASFAVTFRDQGLRARLQAAVDALKGVA